MADFVLMRKSRNILSSVMHVVLNLLLGIIAVASVVLLNTPALGIVLVLVSKWRVLAVRTRFWWPNIKANMVDLIVGVSVVLLTYFAQSAELWVDVLLGGFYCLWLTVIKPLSNERAAIAQSLAAVFLGMSATSIGASNLNVTVAVAFAFLIGYASSRHILVQSNDTDFTLPTLLSGLVFAEVAWLCDTWAIVYPVLGLRIPQVAVILTIFTFVYNYARQAMVKYQDDFRFKHIMRPVVFGIVLIAILVLGFSNPQFHV